MFNPGKEQTVPIPGAKTYRLGKLTVGVLRAFRDHVAEIVGDPFESVERYVGRAPDDVVARLVKDAEDVRDQLRYFSLAAPIAQRVIATEEGAVKLVHLLLLEKDAQATEDDALAVVLHLMEKDRLAQTIARAQGTEGGAEGNAAGGAAGPA